MQEKMDAFIGYGRTDNVIIIKSDNYSLAS